MILKKKDKKTDIVYNLITQKDEQNTILGYFNLYIPKLMDELWKSPK